MILRVVSKENPTTATKAPTISKTFCHQLSRVNQRSRSPRKGSYSVENASGCGASSSSSPMRGSLPPPTLVKPFSSSPFTGSPVVPRRYDPRYETHCEGCDQP